MRKGISGSLAEIGTLLDIGIALSAEKEHDRVLEMIVTEARRVTGADAGTLYLCEESQLTFKIVQNETLKVFLGGQGEPVVNFPPVPMRLENVSAYAALKAECVNIADVYEAKEFDFSGPKRYDNMTGYRTKSMLVVPLKNHESEVIAVLQLINATDEQGEVIPFAPELEKVVSSLASQAAISLTNRGLLDSIQQLFHSFVEVMATAIDAQTPYNAHHTRRVAFLAEELGRAINKADRGIFADMVFDEERLEQLVMSAWLHDIGKIATPLSVMNKATRLGDRRELVLLRMDYIAALLRQEYFEKKMASLGKGDRFADEQLEAWWSETWRHWENVYELILYADNPSNRITDDKIAELRKVQLSEYIDREGKRQPWLTAAELEALCVIKGTLTNSERIQMEEHVQVTKRMLEKLPFPRKLEDVPIWASMHHEHLDGKGYPLGLAGESIPLEARILALVDVFDALTASDRPYKKAMPVDEALRIVGFMVKDGKLDGALLQIFQEQKVWEKVHP
ncbi:HD domain-containing protein [Heliobacillus mobilis]|uniref:HD domain-containing protein n=1 Tax=Heliobacterium mobile TaxID=28064 RepID=A0A6I3SP56_HELMO|nr:HD domain-containing phosphohydrolase [Heliobacterium mobile]MTV50811.1 HD domain-containing protein [Heliobacterium mobile]